MNTTNRGVNRGVLLILGVLVIAVGTATAAAALWPLGGELWRDGTSMAIVWMQRVDRGSRIAEGTTASWFVVGIVATLLLVVTCSVAVIARLGGGRSRSVIREEASEGPHGAVTVRQEFASDAILGSLTTRDEVLSSRVDARHVRGTDVLHISVTPRQNTSPADLARTVTGLVDNLAVLTGRPTPTVVSIHSGIRSRIAADRSRVR